jgi:hypothetical protein
LRHALNVLAGQRAKVGTSHQVLEFLIAPHHSDGALLDSVHASEPVVFAQGAVLVCGRERRRGGVKKKGRLENRVKIQTWGVPGSHNP